MIYSRDQELNINEKKILIVDDEIFNIEAIKCILESKIGITNIE